MAVMGYKTVLKKSETEFVEKKSTFIGSCKRVFSEENARAFILEIKGKYKDARHHVYAYTIGENQNIQRYSDDGEPQGTGGLPVLDVLKKNDLRNVCIVVTRYFGGVLLGAGGLTRAYVKGASDAVKEAGIVERVSGYEVNLHMDYELLGKIQYYFKEHQIETERIEYSSEVSVTVFIEDIRYQSMQTDVMNLTSGKVIILPSEPRLFYKMEHRLYDEFEDG